ncbi:RING finger and CHY zinc finger domain-containing protein 1-like [Oscarella lobularis]|uniref:RING finger and CHY zinc finger domain-containing protein 1-like n=1 Tax=Oscarella lobularis TaxID=121494 RepID=UPI0033136E00
MAGCEHYSRKCALIAPCCAKVYPCRVCHDAAESHNIDRRAVTEVRCNECKTRQPVGNKCENCDVTFGSSYFCKICRLYDDKDKGQFHCDSCGICRVGGRENFFHCDCCRLCIGTYLRNSHKCVERASKSNCPVCMEDLHSSRDACHVPDCGHLIHSSCYRAMLGNGSYRCPTCGKALVDMENHWRHLDEEISRTPMPDEYKDVKMKVLCKECNKESTVPFHVLGHKCQECGSYNTC